MTFVATQIRLRTDPRSLLQMIENLVCNALKFTRGGVLVAARKRGGSVLIEVWDQGAGIEPEQQSRIFDAFHRESGDGLRGVPGDGLGLAVVKRCADLLGLAITVSSRRGRGSVFRIQVPPSGTLAAIRWLAC